MGLGVRRQPARRGDDIAAEGSSLLDERTRRVPVCCAACPTGAPHHILL